MHIKEVKSDQSTTRNYETKGEKLRIRHDTNECYDFKHTLWEQN